MRIELPEHGIALPVTLKRTASPGVYFVAEEPTIIITSWKDMGGRKGNRKQMITWTARFKNAAPVTDMFGIPDSDLSAIAKAPTLARLRLNVAKYLADENIDPVGVGPRRRYGFNGDQRPSATRPL